MKSGAYPPFGLEPACRLATARRDQAPAWRDATAKKKYDIVIIGGGGHGLATAYYPAKNHGAQRRHHRSADRGGNTGRNTTIIRSNYLYPESAPASRAIRRASTRACRRS
ncbi:MAG: FAD-dependent oxidoreductase [Rubrivivax sp.]